MSGPTPAREPTDPSVWMGRTNDRIASLSEYFEAGADGYTPDALRRAAGEAGFSPDEIEDAYSRAAKRRRAAEMTRPIRRRARWIVLAAYGLTYVVLAALIMGGRNPYGIGYIGLGIFTLILAFALAISVDWIKRRRPSVERLEGALMTMLTLPMALLVAVTGICLFGPGA